MNLCQLTGYGNVSVWAHDLHELLQGLHQAVGRLVEDGGIGVFGDLLYLGLPAFLMR